VRIAVVGAGISGLSAAWLLGQRHDVVLYEAEGRLGGHSNTVDVDTPDGKCPIDTGFIVYNLAAYPNLIAFFDALGVETAPSDMSFAVSLDGGAFEYSGSGLGGLFGQPMNIFSPGHWRMVSEIFRFFRDAQGAHANEQPNATLGDWLAVRGYSQEFIHGHIAPMAAAIWSAPVDEMLDFPFAAFSRFFANHGLLQTFGRPAWRTVKGGSRAYVERIESGFTGRISIADPVAGVTGSVSGAIVRTLSGSEERFDAALLACHANDALEIVSNAMPDMRNVLSAFRYQRNEAVLHTDKSLMPWRRRLWSSWNYLGRRDDIRDEGASEMSVTYWMNRLQPLSTKSNFFVTLNPHQAIAEDAVCGRFTYHHPLYDAAALGAQKDLWTLQGRNRIWFAGSYFGYGFHEDGLQSGLAAAEDLSRRLGGDRGSVRRPWTWDERQSRITRPAVAAEPVYEAVL
jgi:uncharacterized protein